MKRPRQGQILAGERSNSNCLVSRFVRRFIRYLLLSERPRCWSTYTPHKDSKSATSAVARHSTVSAAP